MKRYKTMLFALLFALLLPVSARAAGSVDLSADVRLTLRYQDAGAPLSGAQFLLYQVADMDATGELTAKDAFAQFDISIRGENDDYWRALARTMEGYVLSAALAPDDSGRTDTGGMLTFPTGGNTLSPGLYLVIGTRHSQYGKYYDATPFLILLPTQDKDANEWVYDLSAAPKHTSEDIPETPTTIVRRVLKVWDDAGAEEDRPQSVTVLLLCDGEVYDTVTLSAENGWRWEWSGLDSAHYWTVVELTPSGYRVIVTQEGITFVITNTRTPDTPTPDTPDTPTPDTPDTPDTPAPDTPTPDTPDTPDTPTPNTPDTPTLPQTGQLWWPVPLLLIAGAALMLAGLRRRRTQDEA